MQRKMEQSFAAEKLASGWEYCKICRTYANLSSSIKTRCKRKIGSALFPCALHIVPPECMPTRVGGVLATSPTEGECIMLSMSEFPSLLYFKSQRGLRKTEGKGEQTRKGARKTSSVQNLGKFVTPSRNTLVHVVEEIAKFPTGLLRHVSIPQHGCFPLAPFFFLRFPLCVMPKY